jgi:hypothetical protein
MSNSQASGVAYSDPEFSTCYATQEIGYATAAQGAVTQATSKSTAVTLNKSNGQITMNNAALANGASVSFTLNNTLISARDLIIVNVAGGVATAGSYTAYVSTITAGSAVLSLYNISGGSLSEAVVLNYCIIHGQ